MKTFLIVAFVLAVGLLALALWPFVITGGLIWLLVRLLRGPKPHPQT